MLNNVNVTTHNALVLQMHYAVDYTQRCSATYGFFGFVRPSHLKPWCSNKMSIFIDEWSGLISTKISSIMIPSIRMILYTYLNNCVTLIYLFIILFHIWEHVQTFYTKLKCSCNHNIIHPSVTVGWGWEWARFYLELSYVYSNSIALHWQIQGEKITWKQCTDIIRMERLIAFE